MTMYYYRGKPVIQQLDRSAYQRFFRIMLKNPKTPMDVAIAKAKREKPRRRGNTIKHYFNGIPLADFCREHGLDYVQAVKSVKYCRFERFLKKKGIKH